MPELETDYLVIGAGASGLAFTDALIAESAADVIMVDRRERPGGHWQSAYPFVRLHQPSAFYGVNSRPLGEDRIDRDGPNAGFYERANAAAVCDYFDQVLEKELLGSGSVRFFGMCDYVGQAGDRHTFVSRLTGEVSEVRVRRKVVDSRYLETSVPATHVPGFEIDPAARVVPVGGLVDVAEPWEKYVVLGSGKTAMDACVFLLDKGVPPEGIQWIRPRDAWLLDRAGMQPLEQVGATVEAFSLDLEAVAHAESLDDLFGRLESSGRLLRIDESVVPTMYRCAIISRRELAQLRRVEDVVRLGRVRSIERRRIVLEHGAVQTSPARLHVDCTAIGLRSAPPRHIFEPGRITLQQIRPCAPTFNAALIAYVETARDDLAEQNRLCPANPVPARPEDWTSNTAFAYMTGRIWRKEPDLSGWLARSRLNLVRAVSEHLDDPRIQESLERNSRNRAKVRAKLRLFLGNPALALA